MKRTIFAAALAFREALSNATLEREPEPTADMSASDSVRAFHAEGSDQGALLGVYRFNARAVHALTPRGGFVVDLGCGSGQYLKYLAIRRPDIHCLGIDLSAEMVTTGNAMLRDASLADRIELQVGDMTAFSKQLPQRVNTLVSIFSLHHLPTKQHLHACLGQIAGIRSQQGVAVWLFDHSRPRSRVTAELFPKVFTPNASPAFNADSTNSLIASWSFEELRRGLHERIGGSMHSSLSRILPLYQVHWADAVGGSGSDEKLWCEPRTPDRSTRDDSIALRKLFKTLPS